MAAAAAPPRAYGGGGGEWGQVKRCMAALALGPATPLPAYRYMYHPDRWQAPAPLCI
jgi:hypothetical protein